MQNKPGDTPKIIGLIAAIIAVLGFLVWRVVQTTQSATTTAGAVTTTTIAANAPLQTASATVPDTATAASGTAQAGAGQMRYFDEALDADPPQGQVPTIPPPRSDAFHSIKPPHPPAVRPNPRPMNHVPMPPWQQAGIGGPVVNSAPLGGYSAQPIRQMPPAAPPVDIKLDGVILGPDGFAMLTLYDSGARGTGIAEQTVYKRIGQKIAGHVIVGMSDNGIRLAGLARLWTVGQALHFGQTPPPAAPQQAAPVMGSGLQMQAPASNALPPLSPGANPNGTPLQPPTVTR